MLRILNISLQLSIMRAMYGITPAQEKIKIHNSKYSFYGMHMDYHSQKLLRWTIVGWGLSVYIWSAKVMYKSIHGNTICKFTCPLTKKIIGLQYIHEVENCNRNEWTIPKCNSIQESHKCNVERNVRHRGFVMHSSEVTTYKTNL